MIGKTTAAQNAAGINAIHHQTGVLPSAKADKLVGQPAETLVALDHRRAAEFRGRREFFQLFEIGHGVSH